MISLQPSAVGGGAPLDGAAVTPVTADPALTTGRNLRPTADMVSARVWRSCKRTTPAAEGKDDAGLAHRYQIARNAEAPIVIMELLYI
jgi:hypothetical protein